MAPAAFSDMPSFTFLIWNTATTWWIFECYPDRCVSAAILINTFMWSLVMWLFHLIKRRLGPLSDYFSLILFWITWEYFYHNSEISWPWLTLGNGFAYNIRLIQWYEYTGVLGGSLWVLLLNILIFNLIKGYTGNPRKKCSVAQLVANLVILTGPIAISLVRFYTYKEKPDPKTVVVIQPNIDPYEKFVSIPSLEQTICSADRSCQSGRYRGRLFRCSRNIHQQ